MELELRVQDPRSKTYRPLSLRCPPATPGSQLARALNQLWASKTCSWQVQGQKLTDLTLGDPPLTQGAALSLCDSQLDQAAALLDFLVLHGPDALRCFPLQRGSWQLGRQAQHLAFADPALAPFEGSIEIESRGIFFQGPHGRHKIVAGQPFQLGSSICCLEVHQARQEPWKEEDLETVDLPAARPLALSLAMIIFPLIIGLILAYFTSLWFILLLALGSSLLMGLQTWAQGQERSKTRKIIKQREERERLTLTKERGLYNWAPGQGQTGQGQILLGLGTRPLRLEAKGRQLSKLPLVDLAPFSLPLEQVPALFCQLDLANWRFILLQVLRQGIPLYLLLTAHESPAYRQLRQSLTGCPGVRLIDDDEPLDLDGPLAVLLTSRPRPGEKGGSRQIIELSCQPDQEIKGQQPKCWADFSQLRFDGMSQETFEAELAALPLEQSQLRKQLASCTSSLEAFSWPTDRPRSRSEKEPRFFLGINPHTQQEVWLGLRSMGPHFLCAGTTGSGKSQLLRSMLWSLLLSQKPQHLALILIDFKGGAGLGPLSQAPHTVACITDLDSSLLLRSIAYLRADIRKREQEFERYQVSSYQDYCQLLEAQGQQVKFPELIVCIDEFKMLLDDFPNVMSELIRLASIGRSLGYHLILATQRPQGAISQDIRANISTSICLKVNSDQESYNVLGSPQAASIPGQRPGRGYLRDADQNLTPFQAPLITGLAPPSPERLELFFPSQEGASSQQAQALSDTDLAQLNSQLATLWPASSYQPIAPLLQARAYRRPESSARPRLDLGDFDLPALGQQGSYSWRADQGAFLLTGSPLDCQPLVLSLCRQALAEGLKLLVFSFTQAHYQAFEDLLAPYPASCVYGEEDFDFIRHLLSCLNLGEEGLLVIDGMDQLLDRLLRYPEAESQLAHLLQAQQGQELFIFARSSAALRGRYGSIFTQLAWTAQALEADPYRSSSPASVEVPEGQLLLEAGRLQELSQGQGQQAIFCFSQAAALNPARLPAEAKEGPWAQLPAEVSVSQLLPLCQGQEQSLYLGLDRSGQLLDLRGLAGKVLPIRGRAASGKSSLLQAIQDLNPHRSFYLLEGSKSPGLQEVRRELAQADPQALLLIDDFDALDEQVQNLLLADGRRLLLTLALTANSLLSSRLALEGGRDCSLILQPESSQDLLALGVQSLPLDLKTGGQVPAGRALLLAGGFSRALQLPLPSSGGLGWGR
ncbi:MAG: FtsK/SpoIIIE domain-containing protein [Rothia sp. (in: high G+C Gram-positive bacteria)]|nr:FtsK/SpoIIIE domain-containing protein [Rothia sp. (in: high G+C Gram-positive bacteria)]